ncbi:MAG: DNA excision repair protein ERCC-6-like, partial [Paramarteilia canceri]
MVEADVDKGDSGNDSDLPELICSEAEEMTVEKENAQKQSENDVENKRNESTYNTGILGLSDYLFNILFPHQRRGVAWLLGLEKGGILADDMG